MRAARQEFTRCGYRGATTAAIAREADVTEALLFKYFGSKADLCNEAITEPLKQSHAEFAEQYLSDIAGLEDRKERARIYIKSMQNWVYEHSDLLTVLAVLEAHGSENTGIQGGLDWLEPYFDLGTDLLATRPDRNPGIDPVLLSRVSFAAVLACIMFESWLFPATSASRDDIVTAIGDFLIGGIHSNS